VNLTGDYVWGARQEVTGVRLEHWAAWTVTAATPTELWSRLKLPADSPEVRAAAAEAVALHKQIASRAHAGDIRLIRGTIAPSRVVEGSGPAT